MTNLLERYKEQIKETEYWDAKVYDFRCLYFGDEVSLCFENDAETVWEIVFFGCHSVSYETDASWKDRSKEPVMTVKDMNYAQLGYFMQDITLDLSTIRDGFYDVSIDLGLMKANITFKKVKIDLKRKDQVGFFWEHGMR